MRVIGVDTGGTFTDLIYRDNSGFGVLKVLSTPGDPAQAVIQGLGQTGTQGPRQVVHGSTVATNAILERKGAVTALVANRGFTDVIEIGRQNRLRLYDLEYHRPPPLVPPGLRFGVAGRLDAQGREIEPLDPAELAGLAARIRAAGAESVAVCLLFSFLDPAHELDVGRALEGSGLHVSLSHEILAEFREYERTSTTVVNAAVAPRMNGYLGRLRAALPGDGLRIMQSNGGAISAEVAMREPVRTVLSGPAGGAVAALEIGRAAGFDRLITFDMGGTSTDVCLMDRALPLATSTSLAGLPVKTPLIDIHTVGAGGGSLASLDPGGALRVGPESAGADPGPICYGRGAGVTVTDANLFLGRLLPGHFLGGTMRLLPERLEKPFAALAAQARMAPRELAEGVLAVVNSNMERAVRVISVERGFDPRDFTLLCFGGAGGLHAAHLARLLTIPRVLVPRNPGVLSALGMILADVVKDASRTVMLPGAEADAAALAGLFAPLLERAAEDMRAEGFEGPDVVLERFLDMRYQGQSFELTVPLPEDGELAAAFEEAHRRRYGYASPGRGVEVVNVRLRARGVMPRPEFPPAARLVEEVPPGAELGRGTVVLEGREREARLLDRAGLLPGNRFRGPAVVAEYSATTLVPEFASARVDALGNLVLEIAP